MKDLAGCVAELRGGEWLGDAPGLPEYQAAWADENSKQLDAARRGYFQLISSNPASLAVPLAYLAFGEMFAADAAGDAGKYALARQAYLEVLKYPPAQTPILAYAALRLAEVEGAMGELGAAASVKKALSLPRSSAQLCEGYIKERALDVLLASLTRHDRVGELNGLLRAALDEGEALAQTARLAERLRPERPGDACKLISGAPRATAEQRARFCKPG